jgi:hypothetical protein
MFTCAAPAALAASGQRRHRDRRFEKSTSASSLEKFSPRPAVADSALTDYLPRRW